MTTSSAGGDWDPKSMTPVQQSKYDLQELGRSMATDQMTYRVQCRCGKILAQQTSDPGLLMRAHDAEGCQNQNPKQPVVEEREGYRIIDRRGCEEPKEPCRVCGAPECHSREYNRPTMDCIRYLREREPTVKEINTWLNRHTDKVVLIGPVDGAAQLKDAVWAMQDDFIMLHPQPPESGVIDVASQKLLKDL